MTNVVDIASYRARRQPPGTELAAIDAELAEIEREKDELAQKRDRLPRLSRPWLRAHRAVVELVERHWELTVRRGGVLRWMGGDRV